MPPRLGPAAQARLPHHRLVLPATTPGAGHETTLEVIELGERLGFDSAWLRHRHLQYGISSPVAVLAAATQRTRRIELGTAVTPLGWENPLRLAEDLSTVDILSGGRVNPGVSVGPPTALRRRPQRPLPRHRRSGGLRLRAGAPAAPADPRRAGQHVQRHRGHRGVLRPGRSRTRPGWPSASGTARPACGSARWAGEQGLTLLTSSVVRAEDAADPADFAAIQHAQIQAFRAHHPAGADARVSQGLVVIPTDTATPAQAAKYRGLRRRPHPAHGRARRARRGMLFARDLSAPRRRSPRALRARRLPRGRRGGVRPAVQLRARRLRADPHRHRHPARPGAGLVTRLARAPRAAGRRTRSGSSAKPMWPPGNIVGSMPSAAASAVDVRSQSWPADSSPMPTTTRVGAGAQGGDVGLPAGGRAHLVREPEALVRDRLRVAARRRTCASNTSLGQRDVRRWPGTSRQAPGTSPAR